MSEPKTYSSTDIERYHARELTAAERHALEKAALGDPFLADALDGYAAAQTPVADLALLQKRLAERIGKEEKRRGLFYIGANWMKIAALFVIVAAAGWFMVNSIGDKNESLSSAPATQKNLPVELNRATDSTDIVYNNAPAPAPSLPAATEPEREKAEAKATAKQAAPPADYRIPPAAFGTVADSASADKDYAMRGRVADEERKEDALAKKVPGIATTAPVQRQQSAAMDTIKNFNITLKRSDEGLSEVVVMKPKPASAASRKMRLVVDTLEPAEGWTDFNDYVANNLKEPAELKEKSTGGEVELAFEVNGEGEPVNIAVTKSLCQKCDEEAIRLLKEGPKWKKNKKKGKVKIKF